VDLAAGQTGNGPRFGQLVCRHNAAGDDTCYGEPFCTVTAGCRLVQRR
jgi:hypothetical protein